MLALYPGEEENYREGAISYDKNGNILHLERWGLNSYNKVDKIDVLTYQYMPTSNKLLLVSDTADTAGFNNAATGTGPDYTYDIAGNLTSDKNKDIIAIAYNHLNLPTRVLFNGTNKFIEYTYTASGQKLQKKVTDGSTVTTTQYLDGFVYQNTVLQFFNHPEGYVRCTPGVFTYIYQYKDHLGNTRLTYFKNSSNVLEIIEEDNYYPFGLKHKGYNSTVTTNGNSVAQKYMYNGKELQDELGLAMYDFGARNYDPAIGRWMNIDNLSEDYYDYSPYNYVFNDPVKYIDPDGNGPEDCGCCDWFKGFATTAVDNIFGTDLRNKYDTGSAEYRAGRNSAHGTTMAVGVILEVEGAAAMTAGGTGLAASGLTASTGVGAPAGALGAAGSGTLLAAGAVSTYAGGKMISHTVDNMKADMASDKPHGNSKSSTKAQHNYDIKDTHNKNKVVKNGTSSGKETKAGQSYRGNSQANKWNKQEGTPGRYKSETTNRVPKGDGARQKGLDYEVNRSNNLRSQGELDPTKHKRP
jgi:RHS repeat-associated protein